MTSQHFSADDRAALSSVAAARIRGLRAELRINQTEMAIRVGLSRTALSDRESGVKPVNVDELPAFAAVLGVSIEYLLGLTNDRGPRQLSPAGGPLRARRDSNPKPSDLCPRPAAVVDLAVKRAERNARLELARGADVVVAGGRLA